MAVLELGMNHLGEIRRFSELAAAHRRHHQYRFSARWICRLDRAVFSRPRASSIAALDAASVAIVNADDPARPSP